MAARNWSRPIDFISCARVALSQGSSILPRTPAFEILRVASLEIFLEQQRKGSPFPARRRE
jgi:hypothetical protein